MNEHRLAYAIEQKIKNNNAHANGEGRGKDVDGGGEDLILEQSENTTDLGNAERLVRLHGDDLHYCHQMGWFVWDKKRWKLSEQGEVEQMAKDTVRRIYAEAANCSDEEDRKKIATHAKQSESETRIRAMISLAKSEPGIPISISKLDANPWLLNVGNGTLNLKHGSLQKHNREDLITKLISTPYNSEAECPLWIKFQHKVTAGDEELIKFKQRRLGYSLTGITKEQCLFIDYGTGSNGKTTESKTVLRLFEDYGCQCPIETFLISKGDKIPNDIARLVGARLVIASEMEKGKRLAESLIKQLTGGDRIAARFLHQEFFEFTPEFKIWLAVNHLPNIWGTDDGIWRRLRLVPFKVTIPDEEQDKTLGDRLAEELPGILRWAVDGLEQWHLKGLGKPEAVKKATESYKTEMDLIGGFLADKCEIVPEGQVTVGELYESYKGWAEENGERVMSQRALSQTLTERGFQQDRDSKSRFWLGLRMT